MCPTSGTNECVCIYSIFQAEVLPIAKAADLVIRDILFRTTVLGKRGDAAKQGQVWTVRLQHYTVIQPLIIHHINLNEHTDYVRRLSQIGRYYYFLVLT